MGIKEIRAEKQMYIPEEAIDLPDETLERA